MAGQLFIIDTSCLIQAHRFYYPFDIAPSFWNFMKQHFSTGTFILTNKVEDEILKGKDELANWILTELPSSIALDCHADPFVVATALQNSAIVISQEVSAPASQKSIKLPDVCSNFNITHNDTFTLLRRFGFTM